MLDHPHQKSQNQFAGNLYAHMYAKQSTSLDTSFLRYCKEIANLLFRVI